MSNRGRINAAVKRLRHQQHLVHVMIAKEYLYKHVVVTRSSGSWQGVVKSVRGGRYYDELSVEHHRTGKVHTVSLCDIQEVPTRE